MKLNFNFRQEDAQEFLSFIMHQMHDELLKLEGQYSSTANGNGSSLVSSVEDDDWETVGPKNKSAVTRTQNFAPSELSAIFGGQSRSVVKARGSFFYSYVSIHFYKKSVQVNKVNKTLITESTTT